MKFSFALLGLFVALATSAATCEAQSDFPISFNERQQSLALTISSVVDRSGSNNRFSVVSSVPDEVEFHLSIPTISRQKSGVVFDPCKLATVNRDVVGVRRTYVNLLTQQLNLAKEIEEIQGLVAAYGEKPTGSRRQLSNIIQNWHKLNRDVSVFNE